MKKGSFLVKPTIAVLVFAFLAAYLSAAPAFAKEKRKVRILFLLTDERGEWQNSLQDQHFRNIKSFPESKKKDKDEKKKESFIKPEFVKPRDAFDDKITLAVSTGDRAKMLRFPGAFEFSRLAGKSLTVDYVVTLSLFKAEGGWISRGTVFDVRENETEYTEVSAARDAKEAADEALSKVPAVIEAFSIYNDMPVTACSVGKLFHKKGVEHITEKGTKQEFKNPKLAKEAGYSPCLICFPYKGKYKRHDALEAALGRELTRTIEYSFPLTEEGADLALVTKIGNKIVKDNELDGYNYRFKVLDTDVVNAFSSPGGGVYITKGLLEILESEDETAAVIAHEIAHTTKHHAVRMLRRARTYSILSTVLVISTGNPWVAAIANFSSNFFVSGWSREFEADADGQGIVYMTAAGYDPNEQIIVLKKMNDFQKLQRQGPQWFRTHPTDEQRVKEAHKTIANLKDVLEAYETLNDFDPEMAKYIRTHPENYLKDPKFLKTFIKNYLAFRFIAAEEPAQKGADEDYELVPLEQDPNKLKNKTTEDVKPPQKIDAGNKDESSKEAPKDTEEKTSEKKPFFK